GVVDGGAGATTGADGTASATITAGNTPGTLAIQATSASLPADTAVFHLTVTPVASVVTVASNFFSPANDTIPAGGAIRWVWSSGMHNVGQLSGPADFAGSQVLNAPASFGPVQFTVAGTYIYECTVHSGMTGTITVQ
ncbi:MAG TPA: plastocyanin/azurin family copper-binding protein, partial [Gemmatimonadales bacterium]|nr:plastocyanin/azurin family copper-binding protein [Gemmatimonadales bacterium]